jgi:hypothetical protein
LILFHFSSQVYCSRNSEGVRWENRWKKYLNIFEKSTYKILKFQNYGKIRKSNIRVNVLVGKPERKRPLGRPTRRWEDNITMDLQEVGCGGMDWIELA